jgi:hypothetical protein
MSMRSGLAFAVSLAVGCFDPAGATGDGSTTSATETTGTPTDGMSSSQSTTVGTSSETLTTASTSTTTATTPTTGDDTETGSAETTETTGGSAGCADPGARPGCNDGMVAEGDVCFAAVVDEIAPGGSPQRLAVGDVDNDDNLDFVVADTAANEVLIYRGDGSGGFAAATSFNAANPRGVALGHMNADMNLDLVVLHNGGASVTAYSGDGTGAFAFIDSVAFPEFTVGTDVEVGDLDNDGDGDVVVPIFSDVYVIFGTGDALNAPTTIALEGTTQGADQIALAPMVDDSIDIVTSFYDTNNVGVFLNAGNGTFSFSGPVATGQGSDGPNDVVTGDFDDDGLPDVVAAVNANNEIYVMLNDGSGGLVEDVGPLAAGAREVATGDFTGDCIDDLAMVRDAATPGAYEAAFYPGMGDGEFAAPTTIAVPSFAVDLALGDFNNDGVADALIVFGGADTAGIGIIQSQP